MLLLLGSRKDDKYCDVYVCCFGSMRPTAVTQYSPFKFYIANMFTTGKFQEEIIYITSDGKEKVLHITYDNMPDLSPSVSCTCLTILL